MNKSGDQASMVPISGMAVFGANCLMLAQNHNIGFARGYHLLQTGKNCFINPPLDRDQAASPSSAHLQPFATAETPYGFYGF